MKIEYALYKEKGVIEIINAKRMSRKDYFEKYWKHLYCTEDGCFAKLSFVETKYNTKYFRTFPSTEHKKDCPNKVIYDEKGHSMLYNDKKNISDKHIHDVMERAYYNFINDIGHATNVGNRKDNVTKEKEDIGIAALFSEGNDIIEGGKEPYIATRFYNKITEADDMKVRCIIGYVSSIQLLDKHAYINLTPKIKNSVKLHFAEPFKVRNETEFEKLYIIEKYIQNMKELKRRIVCCCVGYVKFVNKRKDINILVDRSNGFILNGMTFYEIVSYINNL